MKSAPECQCEIGRICINAQCCYAGMQVPDNVRQYLAPRDFIVNDDSRIMEVICELEAARKWPLYHSAHEGYAVILEELDELWDHVKTNQSKRDIPAMRKEAAQIAACALRFMEMIDEGMGRK